MTMLSNETADKLIASLSSEPMCRCGDRPLADCQGEWEPGCDLGNNEEFVRASLMTPSDLAALKRGTPQQG